MTAIVPAMPGNEGGTGGVAGATHAGGAGGDLASIGGVSGGGSAGVAGIENIAGSAGSAGSAGIENTAGTAGVGGSAGAGSGGDAGEAGAGGSAGGPSCAPDTCCINGSEYRAGVADPLNVCQVCAPDKNVAEWSAAENANCSGLSSVAPKASLDRFSPCGPSGCSPSESPSEAETILLRVGTVPNTNTRTLILDYSNLTPSQTVMITSAKFSMLLKARALPNAKPPIVAKIAITASTVSADLCKFELTSTEEFQRVECDVTSALKKWFSASPSDSRKLTISLTQSKTSAVALTPAAEDASQRPKLEINYTAQCQDRLCPYL